MQNYCTLFNFSYLSRGLSLYYSLKKVSKNFNLFIFTFDDLTYKFLKKKKIKKRICYFVRRYRIYKIKKDQKKKNSNRVFLDMHWVNSTLFIQKI